VERRNRETKPIERGPELVLNSDLSGGAKDGTIQKTVMSGHLGRIKKLKVDFQNEPKYNLKL
jgi:hypothetical protein